MDVSQLQGKGYTHVHFAFATLSSDYQVVIGDILTTYEFNAFQELQGVKRILSFGGWTFSTDPNTYTTFRQGVTPANRLTLATNIVNFIKAASLDGVDIDWEYPGVRFQNRLGRAHMVKVQWLIEVIGTRHSGHPPCQSAGWRQLPRFPSHPQESAPRKDSLNRRSGELLVSQRISNTADRKSG
jgi:GH18 family chitinase